MATGWICLYRQIEYGPDYFSNSFDRVRCWIDLLLLAEVKPRQIRKRGQLMTLERGDVVKPIRELAVRWQLSVNTVQKRLEEMIADGRIYMSRNNVVNVIHIVNFNKYQDIQEDNPHRSTPKTTHSDTQNDTQTDTQSDTQTDTPYITSKQYNKLYNNSNTIPGAHTREGEEPPAVAVQEPDVPADKFAEFLASVEWANETKIVKGLLSGTYVESYCMRYEIPKEQGKQLLKEFHEECRLKCTTHVNLRDLMSHFISWVNIKFDNNSKHKVNERTTNISTADQRLAESVDVYQRFKQRLGKEE